MIFKNQQNHTASNRQYRNGIPNIEYGKGHRQVVKNSRSPQIRLHYKSPTPLSKHTSEYVAHLIPHHGQAERPITHPFVQKLQPQHSSLVQNNFSNTSEESNRFTSGPQKTLNMTNTPTAVTYSKESQLSNKKSMVMQTQRKQEYKPPTPTHIQILEPITRISQHKAKISHASEGRSNRSMSQQNIKIVIETDSPRAPHQLPPKITVSHIQKGSSLQKQSRLLMKNPQFIVQPSFVSHQNNLVLQKSRHIHRPFTERDSPSKPKVRFVNQNRSNAIATANFPHQSIVNQNFPRNHSFSMDNKILFRKNEPNFQVSNHTEAKVDRVLEKSKSSNFQQHVSFNSSKQTSPIKQIFAPSEEHSTPDIKMIESKRMSPSKPTLNISCQTDQQIPMKKIKKESYKDYYGEYEEKEPFPSFQNSKKQSIYLLQTKITANEKTLISEIFQNETNKALLQMQKIRSKIDDRKLRRPLF